MEGSGGAGELEVLEVTRRLGISDSSVHNWPARYEQRGLASGRPTNRLAAYRHMPRVPIHMMGAALNVERRREGTEKMMAKRKAKQQAGS